MKIYFRESSCWCFNFVGEKGVGAAVMPVSPWSRDEIYEKMHSKKNSWIRKQE